jgi:hypothetical protein
MGVEGDDRPLHLALEPRHDIVDALGLGGHLDLVAGLFQALRRVGADLDRRSGRVGARQGDQIGQECDEVGGRFPGQGVPFNAAVIFGRPLGWVGVTASIG